MGGGGGGGDWGGGGRRGRYLHDASPYRTDQCSICIWSPGLDKHAITLSGIHVVNDVSLTTQSRVALMPFQQLVWLKGM